MTGAPCLRGGGGWCGTFLISVVYLFGAAGGGLLPRPGGSAAAALLGGRRGRHLDHDAAAVVAHQPAARGRCAAPVARPRKPWATCCWPASPCGSPSGWAATTASSSSTCCSCPWCGRRRGAGHGRAIVCAAFVQVGIIVAMRFLHYNARCRWPSCRSWRWRSRWWVSSWRRRWMNSAAPARAAPEPAWPPPARWRRP